MTHEVTVKKLSAASWYGRCSCGEWTGYAKTPDRLRERSRIHIAAAAWPTMTRYIVLVYVRPEGSLSNVFDPSTITVTATDDVTALEVAAAVCEERGWECQTASIIRKEPVQ